MNKNNAWRSRAYAQALGELRKRHREEFLEIYSEMLEGDGRDTAVRRPRTVVVEKRSANA